MSELIAKIGLFHALKLQPSCENECRIWENEINKNLINVNAIRDCFVLLNQINVKTNIKTNKQTNLKSKIESDRVLRLRRKKKSKSN